MAKTRDEKAKENLLRSRGSTISSRSGKSVRADTSKAPAASPKNTFTDTYAPGLKVTANSIKKAASGDVVGAMKNEVTGFVEGAKTVGREILRPSVFEGTPLEVLNEPIVDVLNRGPLGKAGERILADTPDNIARREKIAATTFAGDRDAQTRFDAARNRPGNRPATQVTNPADAAFQAQRGNFLRNNPAAFGGPVSERSMNMQAIDSNPDVIRRGSFRTQRTPILGQSPDSFTNYQVPVDVLDPSKGTTTVTRPDVLRLGTKLTPKQQGFQKLNVGGTEIFGQSSKPDGPLDTFVGIGNPNDPNSQRGNRGIGFSAEEGLRNQQRLNARIDQRLGRGGGGAFSGGSNGLRRAINQANKAANQQIKDLNSRRDFVGNRSKTLANIERNRSDAIDGLLRSAVGFDRNQVQREQNASLAEQAELNRQASASSAALERSQAETERFFTDAEGNFNAPAYISATDLFGRDPAAIRAQNPEIFYDMMSNLPALESLKSAINDSLANTPGISFRVRTLDDFDNLRVGKKSFFEAMGDLIPGGREPFNRFWFPTGLASEIQVYDGPGKNAKKITEFDESRLQGTQLDRQAFSRLVTNLDELSRAK